MESEFNYQEELSKHIPQCKVRDVLDLALEPDKVIELLEKTDIEVTPIPLNENLDYIQVLPYVIYRLWAALKRFPEIKKTFDYAFTHSLSPLRYKRQKDHVLLSFLLHSSRGLIENDKRTVSKAARNCFLAYSVDEMNLKSMFGKTKLYFGFCKNFLTQFVRSNQFKSAVKKYLSVLEIKYEGNVMEKIINLCSEATLTPLETPGDIDMIGMVMPKGIGLNLNNIIDKTKPDEEIYALCSYSVIHELGHFIPRLKILNSLQFAYNTPEKLLIDSLGNKFPSLEGGFIFTLILLGSFEKKFLKDCAKTLANVENWSNEIPIFSQTELLNLPNFTVQNPYNSGILTFEKEEPSYYFF